MLFYIMLFISITLLLDNNHMGSPSEHSVMTCCDDGKVQRRPQWKLVDMKLLCSDDVLITSGSELV